MGFEYKETSKDLQTRIDIHSRYGERDIDRWMIDLLSPAKGSSILDVGCGSGKQCLAFHQALDGELEIIGGDVSPELLEKAKELRPEQATNIRYTELDFNQPFEFEDDSFDLATCCFALYYASDIPFTVREMHRVIKPGGRLFTTGPMPNNKNIFYQIIREATSASIPPMPGSSRYSSEIFDAIKFLFDKTELQIFENPLVFASAAPFIEYTRASLSEDRKLWADLFSGSAEFEEVMKQIEAAAQRREQQDGNIVMTKVVGGIIATK